MIDKSRAREDVLRDGENIRGVSLVHPVSDELLERCLLLVFLQRGWCSHRVVVAIAWCVPESVLEGVVVATAKSYEEVLVVVHGKDASDVNFTKVEISCTCEDGIDSRCVRDRDVHSPCSRTSRDTHQMFITFIGKLIRYTTRLPRCNTKLEVCAQETYIASFSTNLPQIAYLFEGCPIQPEGR